MANGKIPPFSRQPKFKPKGKKPKTPKLKRGPAIKSLDIFEVALSADAGADSSKSSGSSIYEMIDCLSRPQLDDLDKLVQKIQGRILDSKEEKQRQVQACMRISDATQEKRRKSMEAELSFRQVLLKRLAAFDLSQIERSSMDRVKSLCVENKRMSVQAFMHRYLLDEMRLLKSLLDDGSILPHRKNQSPQSLLRRMLDACLG